MTLLARRLARLAFGCALLGLGSVRPAPAQGPPVSGSLSEATRLFADAAYEPALSLLDGLRPSASGELARGVEATRALCLLALGREPEAREAMAAVVDLDPLFVFSEREVAPRVVALFSEVRVARLPGTVRQRFTAARDAFGRKDYEQAAAGFQLVLTLLDLPELRASTEAATFGDMRTLAEGFHDLAVKLLPAPVPPPRPATPAGPTPAVPPAPTAPQERAAAPAGATAAKPVVSNRVEPPVVLDQRIAGWEVVRRPGRPVYKATFSVLIDETGRVESVRILESNDRFADPFVSTAVQQWRYNPATRDGVPVKFTKVVAIAEPAR
jgi:TonB family protein